ncbi:hypothetical protein SRB5_32740 [Streptomyces sp. RB5]|uniref:Uncharacterized protein n=1 Tax=Streptomyces smaragdinus TaxID=2585196 RepID=A0A7K0CIG3_9ACTN|nr:hypothetical protein [Streptomyces smaragdinus]MQY13133.1 hypothetical protein [Streptomyces smaragdinus]
MTYNAFPPQPTPPRPRGPLALIVATVLVAGACGGGLAYAYLTADKADRTAKTTVWKPPGPKDKDTAGGPLTVHTGLGTKLLPIPDNYSAGPDIDEFGNDAELTSKQATALFKQSGRGLPRAERREFDKYVDRMKLKGIAMRSYAYSSDVLIEIQLAEMTRRSATDFTAFEAELNERIGSAKGPGIDGYKDARCFVRKTESDDKLQVMDCTATTGNILVSFSAYGVKPLNKTDAASLLKKQLDHIKSPGEAA